MSNRVIYKLRCRKESISLLLVSKWANLVCDLYKPTNMRGKLTTKGRYHKFNYNKFVKMLEKEIEEDILLLEVSSETESASISQNSLEKYYVTFSFIINMEHIREELESFFAHTMNTVGIVAYKCSLTDNHFQNEEEISHYELMEWSLKDVKTKFSTCGPARRIVDIEYNPGHMHYVNGLMFGSCYRMWFGKDFYQYISKDKLQSFSNCYENIELENEVTRITLYENLWDYAKEENRAIQWDFRRSVGMDEIAHALEEEFSKRKVTDSEMEILTGKFEHGGIRLIHQYFDEKGTVVSKSKAKIVKSAEYSTDGKILFSEERNL